MEINNLEISLTASSREHLEVVAVLKVDVPAHLDLELAFVARLQGVWVHYGVRLGGGREEGEEGGHERNHVANHVERSFSLE